jgi:hypothetical protein
VPSTSITPSWAPPASGVPVRAYVPAYVPPRRQPAPPIPTQLGPAQLGPVQVGPPAPLAALAAGPVPSGAGGAPPTWGPPPAGLDWSDVSSIPDLATNRRQLVALALCLVLLAVTVVVALTLSIVTQGPVSMSPLWGGIAPLLRPGG